MVDALEVPIPGHFDRCRRFSVALQDAICGGQSALYLATMLLGVVIHIRVAIDMMALVHIAPVDDSCSTISGQAHSRADLRSVEVE